MHIIKARHISDSGVCLLARCFHNTPNENMRTGSSWSYPGHTTPWCCGPIVRLIYTLDYREDTDLFYFIFDSLVVII